MPVSHPHIHPTDPGRHKMEARRDSGAADIIFSFTCRGTIHTDGLRPVLPQHHTQTTASGVFKFYSAESSTSCMCMVRIFTLKPDRSQSTAHKQSRGSTGRDVEIQIPGARSAASSHVKKTLHICATPRNAFPALHLPSGSQIWSLRCTFLRMPP
jgi:hypothetical protein